METQKSINRKAQKELKRFDNEHAYISIFAKMVTIFFLNKKKGISVWVWLGWVNSFRSNFDFIHQIETTIF